MWQRIKAAWRFLTGKYPVNKIPSVQIDGAVFVCDGDNPDRFVQLIAWRDTVLALDAQGKIWELRPENGYGPGRCYFVNQLVQESPRNY